MKTTLNINIDLSSKGYSIPADITDKIHALFLDAGWNVDRLEIDNTSGEPIMPVENPKFIRTYKSKPPTRNRWAK